MQAQEKACLGRPFRLGMLYDCRRDSLVPGITLWKSETLNKALDQKSQETSDFEVIAEDSLNEKASQLDIDAGLKLSLLGGLVHVEGAAKFVNDHKSSKHQARVSLKYKSTTKLEQLTMDQLGKFDYDDVFEKDIATHVVTAILYGADAFFMFDRDIGKDENIKTIQGKLKVEVGGLPGLKNLAIGGEGAVDIHIADKDETDKIKCKFYGDLILPQHPTTFQEATKTYHELPSFFNGKSVPKKVWLYPLGELDSKAQKLIREVNERLVNDVVSVLESLREFEMRCSDLISNDVCSSFLAIKEQLQVAQRSVSDYKIELEKRLSKLLPELRGCISEESKLGDLLKESIQSPFSHQSLSKWIAGKEKESKILANYLELLKQHSQVQFKFEENGMIDLTSDLNINMILCFDFNITCKKDGQLMQMEAYTSGQEVNQEDSTFQPWYSSPSVGHELRNQLRLFIGLVAANPNEKDVKYVVTNGGTDAAVDSDKIPIVSLYDNGFFTEFLLPDQPGKPSASKLTASSIVLIWEKPKQGSENIQSYTVLYRRKSDSSDNWHTQKTTGCDEKFELCDLSPNTAYLVKVSTATAAGLGPQSPISDTIKTKVARDGRLVTQILTNCTVIADSSNTTLYQLPTHEVVNRGKFAKVIVGIHHPTSFEVNIVPHKVIMLIGAKSAGKTTLLNGIVNYVMGVKLEDDFRLKVVGRKDATTCFTAYTFEQKMGSSLSYDLTVIDTPGFGNTEDSCKDFVAQVESFFSKSELAFQFHAIGFVVQASTSALTPSEKCVFDTVSKSITNNIVLLATFSDHQHTPAVFECLTEAKIFTKDNYKFDSDALFVAERANSEKLWEMSMKSFQALFNDVPKMAPCSKTMTRDKLREYELLEAKVIGRQPHLCAMLCRRDELQKMMDAAKIIAVEPNNIKGRSISVTVMKNRLAYLPDGSYATSCMKCKSTCHRLCRISNEEQLCKCVAMKQEGYGTENAECGVCFEDQSCNRDDDHACTTYVFEFYLDTKKITYAEVKDLVDDDKPDDEDGEDILTIIKKFDLDDLIEAIVLYVKDLHKNISHLHEMAGSQNRCSFAEFIEYLVDSEKREAKLGWEGRVQVLKSLPATPTS